MITASKVAATVIALVLLALAAGAVPRMADQAPASAKGVTADATSAPSASEARDTRVLEVVVEPIGASTDAAAIDAAKARVASQRDAAKKAAGCERTHAAIVAADPKGTTLAAVRATEWSSVATVEGASLAADAGSAGVSAQPGLSHFRLLREAKFGDGAAGHLEVVIFRTKPGVTREANVALFDKGEADYARLGSGEGGLLAHSLWIAPDGRWVHLLYWKTEADYQRTGKALFATPGVGGWIRSLDFKRFVVYRGDVLGEIKTEAAPAKEPK